ncbi:MAG: hypothetical protein MUP16_09590, partial [Sedimentisphaerales bacterium]|nr:hypothetical protein [Sedimentisphaerales bacterium]
METKKKILLILVLAFGLIVCLPKAGSAAPMGTAWTYQGRLMDANVPADGLYDLQFKLYDVNVAGTQKGSTIDVNELDVIDGQFTILLDFGSDVFNGDDRWLQIGVRPGVQKDPNEYTTLSPRQKVTPTPYALQTRGRFVDSSGNVGIGETNPASKLVVGQSGDILLKAAGEDAGDIIFANSTGTQKGRIYTAPEAGQNKLYLTSGDNIADITIDPIGNVGIGKTNPTAKLDVNGDISAASNYKIGGN